MSKNSILSFWSDPLSTKLLKASYGSDLSLCVTFVAFSHSQPFSKHIHLHMHTITLPYEAQNFKCPAALPSPFPNMSLLLVSIVGYCGVLRV